MNRESKSPLAVRTIEGPLTFTATSALVWFSVPTQRWAFRADGDRLNLVMDMAARVVALAGHRAHWRITNRPYPASAWARGLDRDTPSPIPGYAAHLDKVRQHVERSTMSEKEIYLGVELGSRSTWATKLVDKALRRPSASEVGKVEKEAGIIARGLAQAGVEATLASDTQMEWLIRRSLGLGLAAPGALSPVKDGRWETEDLAELTDAVEVSAEVGADTVKIRRRGSSETVHVAVMSVGRVDEIEVADPRHAPWLAAADSLPFPVEWSIRQEILDGEAATKAVQHKLLIVRDMQRHYHDHDLDEPLALERQARQARSIEDEMTTGTDAEAARVHGWYRLAVAGATEEEAMDRMRQVQDLYRKRQVTIVHSKGQYGLYREFIPGEPVSSTAYRRRLPVLYFASGVMQSSSSLGDRRGPYIGHTVGESHRAVMFDTHFATEVRETSGLVPIVATPGAGKSMLQAFITYEAVRRGITSVLLDPSGPLANLTKLPELAAVSRHIDLTAAPAGTLNPYAVVAQPRPADYPNPDDLAEARLLAEQDRKMLALDVATMLLPPALATAQRTRLLLGDAIRHTGGKPTASLRTVIEYLNGQDHDAQDIARYLSDMAEMPLARLFFPVGQAEMSNDQPVLTVLTLPGLILPPASVPREHWSTQEQMAVPLLHLASWYASRSIYGRPRAERKLIGLDEAHALGEWSAGRALFTRLGRDSRKWNTCVLAASQNPADILGMEVSNFISAAFVGRIEDEQVASDALRMLRVPAGVGYESVLGRLSPRSATGGRSGLREFVMRDVDGNVDRVRIDLDHLPELLAALDTTAAPTAERESIKVSAKRIEVPEVVPESIGESLAPWLPAAPAAEGTGWPAMNGHQQ